MDKRKLHHLLTLLHKIHYSILIGLAIVFAVISVLSLRSNNQQMVILRAAVFTADKNNGDIEGSLKKLRKYVFAHMNTNLSSGFSAVKPPIQLKYHYDRLLENAKNEYSSTNAAMLNKAEQICIEQYPGSVFSQPRLQCAKAYAAEHPVSLKSIPEDQYKFDFASPPWTTDLAGWSMILSVTFLLLFVIRYVSEQTIRHELKSHS
jgi:predicted small secreted protein